MSALFGNPDQDACLVDKSVTLEIGRNSCAWPPVFSARDGGRDFKQAHIQTLFHLAFFNVPL